ncbi:MAG: DUF1566 domain-containing protein [Candidatus Peregrinibacteria bacterium]
MKRIITLSGALGLLAVSATIAYAGSLTPSASPAATSYTLDDIYTRLTTNATATEADHDFAPSGSPAASLRTLTEVYDAIPTITVNLVKLGTSYLGVAGTLTPDGGTATTAAVFTGSTVHVTDDWTLDTGTLTLACATATFDGTANKIANAYDGAGDGSNRWCVTDTGDATATDLLSGQVAWVDGVAVSGSMTSVGQQTITPTTSNTAITTGYHDGTGYCEGDADLATANIKSGTTIFGIAGDSNVVDTTTGDAAAGDILATKKAWVDGAEVTGNIATQTLSAANQTVTAGYYDATTLSTVDSDLLATNIKGGVTLFGVVGTGANLASTFNGTSGAFTGGSQANGGADDFNNYGAPSAGRYTAVWTQCNGNAYNAVTNPGGNYCNTGDSGADAKDNTGLIWSLPCNGSACASFSDSAPLMYTWDSSGGNNGGRTASQLCSDHAGWFLPHQKQLMQAYIDGSYGNLETSGVYRYFWSATTSSDPTTLAWVVTLSNGLTYYVGKTNGYYVRCVRSAS